MIEQIIFILAILVLYSVAEYLIHKAIHPESTDTGSFLITKPYLIAYSCGMIEYVIGQYFFPFKSNWSNPIKIFGIICIIIGLYIRFAAILTAQKSFTHRLRYRKTEEHKLITHGIYHYIRHPGYFGFFVFALGTQIFYLNPISVAGFTYVLWHFFNDRIISEENALIFMFGDEYVKYKEVTPTWIPLIP